MRIAVLADTHLTEADGVCNSPFAVNRLANERLRHVVDSINHLAPDFTIHLGDIVHPVPAVPDLYEQAVGCFQAQVSELNGELLLVPGNHDVGDKPIDWGPAGVISEDHVELWDRYFGANYRAVQRGGCHFIILNAQLINTGFDSEHAQRRWLEDYLDSNRGGRFFVSLHYPPYLLDRDEREHYDNIGEPGRGWLLGLLERHRVEALFAGHVHHFWTYRHGETDCYLLPSTAFVRQDYSEMFRAAPPDGTEFGRNDLQKLGFLLLEVYERGHLCRPLRTEGAGRGAQDCRGMPPPGLRVPFPPHPRQRSPLRFGFDMRKDWLAPVEIPPSGGLDEFDRKSVRNDYPIMALWEMGVRRLRIPRADLDDEARLARLYSLYAQGMRFTLFSYGLPDQVLTELLTRHADLLSAWEVALPLHKTTDLAAILTSRGAARCPPIFLSKLRGKGEVETEGGTYYHVINHGFSVDDVTTLADFAERDTLAPMIDGLVFRVGQRQQVADTIVRADALCRGVGKQASLHVRLGTESPAERSGDPVVAMARAAEALATAHALPSVRVFVDTLADVDRGYFPRLGVLDALWNPREGFHALRALNGLLSEVVGLTGIDCRSDESDVTWIELKAEGRWLCLVLSPTPAGGASVRLPKGVKALRVWDLIGSLAVKGAVQRADGDAAQLTTASAAVLLVADR